MNTLRGNRSFWSFTATQFLGAFNDNAFKQMILLVAVDASSSGGIQALASGLFALPFILFSGVAGWLSDRHGKR
ncbi:MAG: MFS transporter, partial [Planctomycetota bacterium]|nr:MFS transporter [Planctomycetota bacterium]